MRTSALVLYICRKTSTKSNEAPYGNIEDDFHCMKRLHVDSGKGKNPIE